MLLVRCYGLSLSDQYWICPEGSGLTWDAVNFFDNDFSDDIGDVLFGANKKADVLDFSSPDNTSDGNLKKRWKIMGGKRKIIWMKSVFVRLRNRSGEESRIFSSLL